MPAGDVFVLWTSHACSSTEVIQKAQKSHKGRSPKIPPTGSTTVTTSKPPQNTGLRVLRPLWQSLWHCCSHMCVHQHLPEIPCNPGSRARLPRALLSACWAPAPSSHYLSAQLPAASLSTQGRQGRTDGSRSGAFVSHMNGGKLCFFSITKRNVLPNQRRHCHRLQMQKPSASIQLYCKGAWE